MVHLKECSHLKNMVGILAMKVAVEISISLS